MFEADIAKLRGILAAGVLKTRLADGKEVTFANAAELKERIKYLEGLDAGPVAQAQSATTYVTFGRG